MTGRELAELRRAARLSQAELARRAGIGRHAVSYWECKSRVARNAWAVRKIGEFLTFPALAPRRYGRANGPSPMELAEARALAAFEARLRERREEAARKRRVRCGAKTRKGAPCRGLSEPGKRRCRFHGGRSTGPRSPEGRERIASAQRARWARWRAGRASVIRDGC